MKKLALYEVREDQPTGKREIPYPVGWCDVEHFVSSSLNIQR
jgi:hypothetical protein